MLYVKSNLALFKKNSERHNVNTRNKDELANRVSRLHRVTNTFMGLCVRFYNKIPSEIQNLPYLKFKKVIKEKLYKKGYYRIFDYLEDENPWD